MLKELTKISSWLLIIALSSSLPALAIYIDIVVFEHGIPETGATESFQHLLLAGMILLFVRQTVRCPEQRGFLILVSGFFTVLLIRELDFLLDFIRHGFWLYPALLVTLLACIWALLHRHTLLMPLLNFVRSPQGSLILVGLIILLFFSRIFGTGNFWRLILDNEQNLFLVKTAVQEGIELWGYILVFLGSLTFCLYGKRPVATWHG